MQSLIIFPEKYENQNTIKLQFVFRLFTNTN